MATESDTIPAYRLPDETALIDQLAAICRPYTLKPVFPFYIAAQIRTALNAVAGNPAHDYVIEPGTVSVETLGDCRYAVHCRDFNGQGYRVTVELVERGQ